MGSHVSYIIDSITRYKRFVLKKQFMGYFAVYSVLQFSQSTTVTSCALIGVTTEHIVCDYSAHGAFQKTYENICYGGQRYLKESEELADYRANRSSAKVKLDCMWIGPQRSDNFCDSNMWNMNLSCCCFLSR